MILDRGVADKLGLLTFIGLVLCSAAHAQSEQAPQLQLGPPPGVEQAAPAPEPDPAPEQPDTASPSQLPVPALTPEQAATGTQATFVTDGQLTADADRLEAAFAKLADRNSITAVNTVASFVLGGLFVAGGIYVATDEAEVAEDEGLIVVSSSFFVLGGGLIAAGFHSLSLETPDQERIGRFRAARAMASFDRVTLARFEGELKADAQTARFMRLVGGVQSIGVAAAGVATLAVTGTADDVNGDDPRTFGYAFGASLIAIGTLQAIICLAVESDHETELYKYQAPAPASPKVSVAPAIGARALGLSLKATL